jgi:plastocyanin
MCFQMRRAVLVTAAAGACVCAGCESGGNVAARRFMDAATSSSQGVTPTTPVAPAAPAVERRVAIENFTFAPARVVVPAGARVVWVNKDDVPHSVVNPAKEFTSGALDTDEQYTHVFTTVGTYAYFCGLHPHMTGQVVVE